MSVPLLIYDGECPMCRRARQWIEDHVAEGSIEYMACQSEERARRAPQVAFADCMQALQLVMPNGQVFSGERALPQVLRLTRRYAWLRWAFAVPGAEPIARVAYRLVARNRMRLSAFFVEKAAGESCSIDKGCE